MWLKWNKKIVFFLSFGLFLPVMWSIINPTTYGILTFRQLRGGGGGGGIGPDSENKVTVNGLIWNLVLIIVWMIQVNMQNFKLMAFLLLEIWHQNNFLSKMKRVITIRYLPPGFKQNSTKTTFVPENIFPGINLYLLCISMVLKRNKKLHMLNFSRRLISKTTAATPWWIDFAKILPQCV